MDLFFSDEGPMLETLDYTIRIGSTPTFLYFDLYLYSARLKYIQDEKIGFTYPIYTNLACKGIRFHGFKLQST